MSDTLRSERQAIRAYIDKLNREIVDIRELIHKVLDAAEARGAVSDELADGIRHSSAGSVQSTTSTSLLRKAVGRE